LPFVGSSAFFLSYRRRIVALVSRHGLPASYASRQYAEVGGLMSYGPSQTDAYRRAAGYVGRNSQGRHARRERDGPRNPADAARPRRRGDRVVVPLIRPTMFIFRGSSAPTESSTGPRPR
jgi:hypothetical protein